MRNIKRMLLLCLCAVLLLAGCGKKKTETAPTGAAADYTVTVTTSGGMGIENVNVFVYENSTLQELVAVSKTDAEGKACFTAPAADTYVAVLKDLPTGYSAEEYYPITGAETVITLQTGEMDDTGMEGLTYKLGDAMMNFSVTDADGTTYTFNELLQGKKAVVLNFFYNECQPCMNEFPYLQEAYAQYSDDIAVLAMNPVNTDAQAVAALRQQLGVTFPMVVCDPRWESVMQLTAYPTTVFIDRYGNICLIHKGSVPDTKTFADAFAYFAADNYEQKLIEAIGDLLQEEPEGTKENPTEIGGVTSFEVTVGPDEVTYVNLYKVTKMYLQIKNENAFVIYKDKTYWPKNGKVSVMVSVPDTFTPTLVGIGNAGSETETFKVSLVAPTGSFNNPIKLALGDFTAKVTAGNEQGVYYTYKAAEEGTLTLTCIGAPNNVKYSYYLFNTNTGAMRNLESDANTDENGVVSVSVQAKKGHKIQICISTLPDDRGSYPGGTFKFNASFTAGQLDEGEQVKTTDYTVTITDDQENPMPNISVLVKVGEEEQPFSTDAQGVAKITLPTGTYEGSFYVPDGYTAETTTFTLTEEAPNVKLTVTPIRKADYTVTVVDTAGTPLQNVVVRIGDGAWQRTDAQGQLTVNLDIGNYTVTLMLPEGYYGETTYTFPEGQTSLTVVLSNLSGTVQKPEVLTQLGLMVTQLAAGDADGYYYSYTVAEEGIFSLQVKNTPAAAYDVELSAGTRTARLSESETDREVTLAVSAGETVLIHVYALAADDGSYPAIEVRLWTAMKPLPAEPEDPTEPSEPSTEPSAPTESDPTTEPTAPTQSDPTTAPSDPTQSDPTTEPSEPAQTEPSTEPSVPAEPSEPAEPTEPETTPTVPAICTYTVTVTDAFGAGVRDIAVLFLQNGAPVKTANTNTSGVATVEAAAGEYTVELVFGQTQYYYDKAAAVLTAENRNLTIKLAALIDESDYQEIYILNGNPAYTLYLGGTHVSLGSGKPNFSAEYGSNCFYVFSPEEAGTYQITAAPDVELTNWSTTNFINCLGSSLDEGSNHALTLSISGSSVGNVTYVIGVKADTAVTEAVVTIARIGEPEFNIADQPWSEWETGLTHTDAWMRETGTVAKGDGSGYNYNFRASYLDITAADGTYNLYYDETNGYYRLYEGGPVVLVDLGAQNRFVSLFERVNGRDAYGGSAVTRYFFDETGAFVRKENYTDYLNSCFDEMLMSKSNPTGFYPLTKDLMYVLQNGFVDWWNQDSPNYLEGFATANKAYAWMFPCCIAE